MDVETMSGCAVAAALAASAAALALAAVAARRAGGPACAPHAELLGRACWMDGAKYRVVAVSHKGAVAIRRWDDASGGHAFWVNAAEVARGRVRFSRREAEWKEVP